MKSESMGLITSHANVRTSKSLTLTLCPTMWALVRVSADPISKWKSCIVMLYLPNLDTLSLSDNYLSAKPEKSFLEIK